jgi:dienelactone hydrolase
MRVQLGATDVVGSLKVMGRGVLPLILLLMSLIAVGAESQTFDGPDTVVVRSGALQLRALLWRPNGKGPFPAVLFNHGRGLTPQTAGRMEGITKLARVFTNHGYVFMALFRRGEGLSADQGVFIGNLLERERVANGDEAATRLQVQLLESDHLEDALAGLAFLRAAAQVDPRRVAVVGHSFGGSLSLLVAERDRSLRAVVSFAGAAGSWEGSPDLRARLMTAVGGLTAPVLFVYSTNDFSVAPGTALDAEMARLSKIRRLELFPPFGKTAEEGHGFVYLGAPHWERDVFSFLDDYMKP